MVAVVQESLALQSLLSELKLKLDVKLQIGLRTAKCSTEKLVLHHMKRMQMRVLFLKDLVNTNIVKVVKVPTRENISDFLAKLAALSVGMFVLAELR